MGMGKDSVMIIHGGGTFQDKPATLERIKKNYKERLPDNVKGRVVLENDEMCYNVDDLLPLCEELNIPMVLGGSNKFKEHGRRADVCETQITTTTGSTRELRSHWKSSCHVFWQHGIGSTSCILLISSDLQD
jgi:UV DNA damage repair endonuclease